VAVNAPAPSDWGSGRRWATWANVVLQGVLLLALLAVVSLLARGHARRFDLTSRRSFTVTAATEGLLRGLPYTVTVWVNNAKYATSNDRSLSTALTRTMDLLHEFEHRNPDKFRVRLVSDETQESELFRHWPSVQPATLYFRADLGPGRENKRVVEVYQLYHGDHATGEIGEYRGEALLSQAIRELGAGVRRTLYETEGHGELSTADPRYLSNFKSMLSSQEGVEFRKFPIATYKSVPPDCDVLLVMGPAQPFADDEIGVLKDYLERGGSLLVALRPRVKSGLEGFLEEYGVAVGDNLVLDATQGNPKGWSELRVRDFNAHDINQGMAGLSFLLAGTSTVDPLDKGDASWKITPLAMSSPDAWAETGATGPGTRPRPDGKERVGNLKLIVAVEKPAAHPADEKHRRAKVIIWGSTSPFTNEFLSPNSEYQWTYLVNHYRWLVDRSLLELPHEKVAAAPLDLSAAALTRLQWMVYLVFPAFAAGLGVLAWYLRRK
jgi:hypothetical protein